MGVNELSVTKRSATSANWRTGVSQVMLFPNDLHVITIGFEMVYTSKSSNTVPGRIMPDGNTATGPGGSVVKYESTRVVIAFVNKKRIKTVK